MKPPFFHSINGALPTHFTIQEDGHWILIHLRYAYVNKPIHAMRYQDGTIWDQINGWRTYYNTNTLCMGPPPQPERLPPVVTPQVPLMAFSEEETAFIKKILHDHAEGIELKKTSDLHHLRQLMYKYWGVL
jgi:hypothetical protein